MKHTTKSSRGKIIAGIGAVAVAAAGYGVYASTLSVADTNAFSAGSTTQLTAGCDDAVTVDTGVSTTPVNALFPSSGATVTGVAAACSGKTITVQALDAGKNVIATGATTADGSGTANVNWGSSVADANTIAQYAVIIRAGA